MIEGKTIESDPFGLIEADQSSLTLLFFARDPENLKKAGVGDLVVITYTEAVALSVEKAHAE